MLVLGGVSLAGTTWAASNALAQKGSEKLLRVDLLLPKLKSIHWERSAGPLHLFGPAANAKERQPAAPHVPPPKHGDNNVTVHETPHHSSDPAPKVYAALPLVPPIVDACDEPAVYLNPCTSQRGDSPMMRNWKTLTMYSLLTAAAATFAPPPLLMAADDNKESIDKLSAEIKAAHQECPSPHHAHRRPGKRSRLADECRRLAGPCKKELQKTGNRQVG